MARVNCNFLPLEQRAFILEKKVLLASILCWVVSFGIFASVFAGQKAEAGKLTVKIKEQEREKGAVLADRAATQYPQDQIQALMDKFQFIQKAMGANDFPWLRFYQSIEDAMVGGEGGRKVSIISLKRCGDKCWTLEGESDDWKDATRFEEQLIASTYGTKKNFGDVRLLNYRQADKGYRFTIQFNFNEPL